MQQSARRLLINRPKFLRLRRIRKGKHLQMLLIMFGHERPKVNLQHEQLRQQHGIFSLLMSTTKKNIAYGRQSACCEKEKRKKKYPFAEELQWPLRRCLEAGSVASNGAEPWSEVVDTFPLSAGAARQKRCFSLPGLIVPKEFPHSERLVRLDCVQFARRSNAFALPPHPQKPYAE
jgi:hypothetical protein